MIRKQAREKRAIARVVGGKSRGNATFPTKREANRKRVTVRLNCRSFPCTVNAVLNVAAHFLIHPRTGIIYVISDAARFLRYYF